MRVITDSFLRAKCYKPSDIVYLEDDDYITQQAKEYINSNNLQIVMSSDEKRPMPMGKRSVDGYVSIDGEKFSEKPEHMTHLKDNILVDKTSNRIKFRGMLDYAQAKTIESQIQAENQGLIKLSNDLESLLKLLRKLMSCEVLDTEIENVNILGLSEEEIREMSHNPSKYLGVSHFLPCKSDGFLASGVNTLRTIIRQTELSAMDAYKTDDGYIHEGSILALNRASSAVYIIYCRIVSGFYNS